MESEQRSGGVMRVVTDWLKSAFAKSSHHPRTSGGEMHYEILIEGREPIDAWSICTICLQVDRTASVRRRRWRCSDCSSIGELQQPLIQYLDEHSVDTLDQDLKQWGSAKGVRAAYKMLKSARFKCLITLNRRRQPDAAPN
jgi:hypothetical protein